MSGQIPCTCTGYSLGTSDSDAQMSGIKFWNGGMSFYTFNLSRKCTQKSLALEKLIFLELSLFSKQLFG